MQLRTNQGTISRVELSFAMAVQKQTLPSFASVISVLSIVFYCVGFIRIELELNQHKKRLDDLESIAETKPPSKDSDVKVINNALGKFTFKKMQSTSYF